MEKEGEGDRIRERHGKNKRTERSQFLREGHKKWRGRKVEKKKNNLNFEIKELFKTLKST